MIEETYGVHYFSKSLFTDKRCFACRLCDGHTHTCVVIVVYRDAGERLTMFAVQTTDDQEAHLQ